MSAQSGSDGNRQAPRSARLSSGRLGPLWTCCSALPRRAGPSTCCRHWSGKRFVIAVPYLWLFLFFLVPVPDRLQDLVLRSAASRCRRTRRCCEWVGDTGGRDQAQPRELHVPASPTTCTSAPTCTRSRWRRCPSLWCLAIGYPMAYAMARSTPTWRNVFLLLVMLPFVHLLPAARLRLDRAAQEQRRDQQRAHGVRA